MHPISRLHPIVVHVYYN